MDKEGFLEADVSAEQWREYLYPDDVVLRINKPKTLFIDRSNTSSHRIVDVNNCAYYPQKHWFAIKWHCGKNKFPIQFLQPGKE